MYAHQFNPALSLLRFILKRRGARNTRNLVRFLFVARLDLLGRCVIETRTLSHLLHPPLLEEAGFASAARDYVEEFARRSGIETDILLDLPYRLPGDTEILLFRVLQESLTNIHRHSGSNRAKIRAGMDGEVVSLEIRDYGHGISQEVLEISRPQDTALGSPSLESASDCAKWTESSSFLQQRMAQSCE